MNVDLPVKILIKEDNDRQPVKTSNATRKEFFSIPTKDIEQIKSTKPSFKFIQDVSSFVGRSDYKDFQLDAHIDDTHLALTSRFKHLESVPKEFFMTDPKVKTAFAKLVALSIRTTECVSGSIAQLDKMYLRINLEKKKLMHWFEKYKYKEEDENWGYAVLMNPNGLSEYKNSLLYKIRNPH